MTSAGNPYSSSSWGSISRNSNRRYAANLTRLAGGSWAKSPMDMAIISCAGTRFWNVSRQTKSTAEITKLTQANQPGFDGVYALFQEGNGDFLVVRADNILGHAKGCLEGALQRTILGLH